MPRNEIGHGDQRSSADDISVLLEDGPISLQCVVIELGESIEYCRRQLNDMQTDGLIVLDKEEPNWIVETK